jgi:hypothetical protein
VSTWTSMITNSAPISLSIQREALSAVSTWTSTITGSAPISLSIPGEALYLNGGLPPSVNPPSPHQVRASVDLDRCAGSVPISSPVQRKGGLYPR